MAQSAAPQHPESDSIDKTERTALDATHGREGHDVCPFPGCTAHYTLPYLPGVPPSCEPAIVATTIPCLRRTKCRTFLVSSRVRPSSETLCSAAPLRLTLALLA
jgi:hypothetical protein